MYFTELQTPQFLFRRKDQNPVYQTNAFSELFGLSATQFQTDLLSFSNRLVKEQGRKFWKQYQQWDGNGVYEQELALSETPNWYRLSVKRSEDGLYDLFQFTDITKEREEKAELTERLNDAAESSRSKTAFLSKMSHEIRTPMNGIIGMLTLAHAQLHGHVAESYISKAENLSAYLLSVLNDILDMSRIEAGKVELAQKPIDLTALAEKLRDLFQKNVEAKGIAFSVEMQDFDVRYVIGDELRLSQVLVNFLSNAQKFTSQGEIKVIFRQLLREADKVSIMIRVHDTGAGMDPNFLNRIFLPFEQESADTAKQHGGSGLGMAITDNLVRLMGGEIVVESMPGKGSDFTVYLTLPIASEEEAALDSDEKTMEPDAEFTYAGCHILMAEDNEINAEIAVSILEEAGATVDVAENGQVVQEMFAEKPEGTYNFILMDIQMPLVDGRTAARQIRAMNRPDAQTIPIFALSADAFVEDQRRSLESGMNGHFSKPIDFEKMRIEIGNYLRRR
ncbi:ATP-binding protein [Clostridium sp. OM02-18AC]|uniref:ATP-binding protein n=1 Tax=Clostridium sp. OM02-18AC TaxID=2292311 RepID=UPI001A9AB024|nr:ATP-binding protein [Clostridium sp. OM02-18AC]